MHYEQAGNSGGNILKGLAAGVIAGLVASAAMNQFQKRLSKMLTGENRSHGPNHCSRERPAMGPDACWKKRKGRPERRRGRAIGQCRCRSASTNHELDEDTKATAGTLLHYGFGMSMGALLRRCCRDRAANHRRCRNALWCRSGSGPTKV